MISRLETMESRAKEFGKSIYLMTAQDVIEVLFFWLDSQPNLEYNHNGKVKSREEIAVMIPGTFSKQEMRFCV